MVTTFRKPGLAAWQGRGSAGGFRVPCRYNARRQPGTTREHQIGQVDSPHGGGRHDRAVRGRAGSARQWREDRQLRHRSEEHTSELQSLMRISYAVFCLKKKTKKNE